MNESRCCSCDPQSLAVALGRWAFGILFLFAGIGKISSPAGFAKFLVGQYEKTWLPNWLLTPYGYALPFIEVALGVLLLLGIARNVVLFVTGLLLLSLTFGQILLQSPVAFNNLIYTLAVAALLFLADYDSWVLGIGNRPRVSGVQPGLG